MAAITSANIAQAIVKLVAADALPALIGNLVMGNLVNRNYEPVLGQAGDTVNIPIVPSMVANNIAEDGTVSTQNPSLGNSQIVLNTHAESTFQIPDVTKVLAVPDLLKIYMEPAVIAIAEKIETDLLNLYASFTANATLGTAGTTLTEAVIDSAETTLFQAKMPQSQPKYLVVDPDGYSALRQIPRFSEFQTAGDAGVNALVRGTVGRLKVFLLFRISVSVHSQNWQFAGDDSQFGFWTRCNCSCHSASAAASAGYRRDCRLWRTRQLRNADRHELSAEHARAAVYGGRALRHSCDPQRIRRSGRVVEQTGTTSTNNTPRDEGPLREVGGAHRFPARPDGRVSRLRLRGGLSVFYR